MSELLGFIFFLYSYADTMLAALVKPFIIEMVRSEMVLCDATTSQANSIGLGLPSVLSSSPNYSNAADINSTTSSNTVQQQDLAGFARMTPKWTPPASQLLTSNVSADLFPTTLLRRVLIETSIANRATLPPFESSTVSSTSVLGDALSVPWRSNGSGPSLPEALRNLNEVLTTTGVLGLGAEPCAEEVEVEELVQGRVAAYLMMDLLCVFLPGFFMGLGCGAWSDR